MRVKAEKEREDRGKREVNKVKETRVGQSRDEKRVRASFPDPALTVLASVKKKTSFHRYKETMSEAAEGVGPQGRCILIFFSEIRGTEFDSVET
jgi:hypothetical protein